MSEAIDVAKTPNVAKAGGFFGHPRGLAILFFTEMWERFSYYGMRGLLILYLTQHFLFSDQRSAVMYGAYTALVYIMTIVGGSLADRYLGQRKAVIFGAILLVLGHFGMAFEGEGSKETLVAPNQVGEVEIIDEGRGSGRKLFVSLDGEIRRLVFEARPYALLRGAEQDGSDRILRPITENGDGDYSIEEVKRSFLGQICAPFGLACAGPEPKAELVLSDGQRYRLYSGGEGDEQSQYVLINGEQVQFVASPIDAVILETDDRTTPYTALVYRTVADGEYSTRVERQDLYVNILYLSLALIIAGVGYLKANISTIVGALYKFEDPRRDSGFTLFYMGINLGSFLSSITCGILGIVYGWKYGFGLAGIGMLLGLIVFIWGQKYLEGHAEPPDPAKLKKSFLGPINIEMACYLAGVLIVAVSMAMVMNSHLIKDWFVGMIGLAFFIFLVGYSIMKLQGDERTRMFAAIYFVLAQIPFWALFEQAGSSLNLFTDRLVDKEMFGVIVPAPVFQSLNAGFIFLFAPLVAWLWIALAKRGREPSTPVKFSFGVIGVGLGFLALVAGITASGPTGLTAVYFIFLVYWIHTMAELMLSPVGLSAVTKMAPARVVGMTMGAWFLYTGLSNYLAGIIARGTGADTIGGQLTDVAAAKATYASVYTNVSYVAIGVGVVMLLISPLIKSWMKLDEPKLDDDDGVGVTSPTAQPVQ
ncbi:peptide MFS transporter [Hyphococcus sp.]|uniref:peptide MFS transporter n=1 Tax=Hyphococcus sp. TaxID=2038636 RepID=UPI003CCBA82C